MPLAKVFSHPLLTTRVRLASLIVACVLPLWLAAGYLVFTSYNVKLDLTKRYTLETARALLQVVERDQAAIQAALGALATSQSLASGNMAAFHARTIELSGNYEGSDIILADLSGQQLVNSFVPFGSPLPKRNLPEATLRAIRNGQTSVSGLFKGAVTGRYLISVDVPVFRDSRPVYDLSMTIPADRFAAILSHQHFLSGWVGTVLDQDRVVVARTLAPERFVGVQRGDTPLMRRLAEVTEDAVENTMIDGTASFASFSRSRISGWSVVINVPKVGIMADIWRWLRWTIAGASLMSIAGIAVAVSLARSIDLVMQKQNENEALRDDIERITQHDLKSPLASLISGCAYLLDNQSLDSESKTILMTMENTGRRMLDSINVYFNIQNIEKNKFKLNPVEIDLIKSIYRIWDDFNSISKHNKLQLKVYIGGVVADPSKSYLIYAEKTLILSMLYNLINNALQASPDNEMIIIELGEVDNFDVVSIRNKGSVPAEIRGRIFEKYVTFGKSGGTGLGTYSAKLIAESHGGDIALDASVEGETTITVRLRKMAGA
jgi:signal transduction histidine kinase